jgi:serine protease Do
MPSIERASRTRQLALCTLVVGLALAAVVSGQAVPTAEPPAAPAPAQAPAAPPPPPSSLARRLYDVQKDKLVQVRVLVAGAESQASSGSGFFVASDGLLVTNYHVISQLVLEPERYRAEFVRTDATRGAITVIAIDVQHDLALIRTTSTAPAGGWPVVNLAPDDSLSQGDKVFSLGNPLDLGFAISEGTFNGRPERSLYPHLLFTGAMNPGVSGGPAMDESGRVVGVNVAGYGRAAELTNFQVPVKYVRELIARGQQRPSATNAELRADMRTQLIAHQNLMLDGLHKGEWKTQALGAYRIPVIPETLARCWGSASDSEKKNSRYETARCSLASDLYIDSSLRIGGISTQHEYSTTTTLSALRFAHLRTKSFRNERFISGSQGKHRTASRCEEDFVKTAALTLRAVICVRAYKKFEGLYDFTAMTTSLDGAHEGLESTLTLSGVDYARGVSESRNFIEAITRLAP